jgi:hypothetical protein
MHFMVILRLGATGGFWVGGRPRNLSITIIAIDRWSMTRVRAGSILAVSLFLLKYLSHYRSCEPQPM